MQIASLNRYVFELRRVVSWHEWVPISIAVYQPSSLSQPTALQPGKCNHHV